MFVKISFLSATGSEATALRFLRSLAIVAADLLRALRHRREVLRLAELDDRTLKDIGLLRSDVEGALREPFHKDPSRRLRVRRLEHHGRSRPAALSEPPSASLGCRI